MQMTSLIRHRRSRVLMLVAALVYLLSQTIDLQHTHDGDLNLHADCQICLKLTSQSDASIVQVAAPPLESGSIGLDSTLQEPTIQSVLKPNSRAPPHFI